MHHLVGASEIAAMLGISRQRVDQLAAAPGFPAPEAKLEMGRVWSRARVVEWAQATGRTVEGNSGPDN